MATKPSYQFVGPIRAYDNDTNYVELATGALSGNFTLTLPAKNGFLATTNDPITIYNKTSAYTVIASDFGAIINCTSGTFTVSLTAAATLGAGFNVQIWNTGSGSAISIVPASGLINGVSSMIIRQGERVTVVCDGSNFFTSVIATRGFSSSVDNISGPTASGLNSFAIASGSTSSSDNSGAIGRNSSGGGSQAVTGAAAMALGGSYASGTDSFAAAVTNNTSSYGATGANSVAFGLRAKASNSGSFSFGEDSQATGLRAVAFGYQTVATGTFSPFAVGYQNTASGSYSVAFGSNALAALYGKQAFASGRFAANGDAQSGKMVLRGVTTDATATVLTSDGAAPGATNQVILPANGAIHFNIRVIARQRDLQGQDAAGYTFTGVASRSGSGGNVSLRSSAKTVDFESDATWDCIILEDDPNAATAISVTGAAGKIVRWVAVVEVVEVIYG